VHSRWCTVHSASNHRSAVNRSRGGALSSSDPGDRRSLSYGDQFWQDVVIWTQYALALLWQILIGAGLNEAASAAIEERSR